MGTIADTANVDYRLSSAEQGKQTSIFCIYILYILHFLYMYINIYIYRYMHIYLLSFQTKTENRSPGDFLKSVYSLLIAQTEVCRLSVYFQRYKLKFFVKNGLNGLNGLNWLNGLNGLAHRCVQHSTCKKTQLVGKNPICRRSFKICWLFFDDDEKLKMYILHPREVSTVYVSILESSLNLLYLDPGCTYRLYLRMDRTRGYSLQPPGCSSRTAGGTRTHTQTGSTAYGEKSVDTISLHTRSHYTQVWATEIWMTTLRKNNWF